MALAAASTFLAFGGVYLLCAMAGLMALFGVLKLPSRKISHDGKPKAQELLASLRLMVGDDWDRVSFAAADRRARRMLTDRRFLERLHASVLRGGGQSRPERRLELLLDAGLPWRMI